MKKVVVFGGGTGLSQLLKGLKMFPIDITAVVSVSDNGKSTGKLREEYNIPAVGDISKVLLSMSNMDKDIIDLMNYRFEESNTIDEHSIKNLLLTALLDLKGNFKDALPILCKLLDIEGNVIPLTEESLDLVGVTEDNKEIYGEEQITSCGLKIKEIKYNKEININPSIYDKIDEADLIIFSSGSMLTSIIPHIVDKNLATYISKAKAKKLMICNLFTQPGETDEFKVSDHIELIEKYLAKKSINAIIVNNKFGKGELTKKYLQKEQKDFIEIDYDKLGSMDIDLIVDNLLVVDGPYYRHNALKTAYLIFSYIMESTKL